MDRAVALVALAVLAIPPLGCARSKSAPPPVPSDSATILSVFADTGLYRRYCVVPTGQAVDVRQPCLLLDQSRSPQRPSGAPGPRPR